MNKDRVNEAVGRVSKTFEELSLTMEERAVVAYSAYTVAKNFETLEELMETRKTEERPQQISKIQIITTVCSTLAIIIGIIAMLLK